MVQPKRKGGGNWLTDELDRVHKRTEKNTIRFRWSVVEVTPSKRYAMGDGHGGTEWAWSQESSKIVSPFFENEDEAKVWMDAHEPDEGKSLKVHRQRLLRHEWTEWVNY